MELPLSLAYVTSVCPLQCQMVTVARLRVWIKYEYEY